MFFFFPSDDVDDDDDDPWDFGLIFFKVSNKLSCFGFPTDALRLTSGDLSGERGRFPFSLVDRKGLVAPSAVEGRVTPENTLLTVLKGSFWFARGREGLDLGWLFSASSGLSGIFWSDKRQVEEAGEKEEKETVADLLTCRSHRHFFKMFP